MRHGRAKAARRTLQFFERTVGIKAPYHILVDGTFLVAIMNYKIPIYDRLEKLLQHNNTFILYWTDTTIQELEKLHEHHAKKQHNGKKDTTTNNNPDKLQALTDAIQWGKNNCQTIELLRTNNNKNSNIPTQEQCTELFHNISNTVWSTLSDAAGDVLRVLVSLQFQKSSSIIQQNHTQSVITTTSTTENSATAIIGSSNAKQQQSRSDHHHYQQQQHLHSFFCASQDEELLDIVRQMGFIPVIRLARGSVMLLEQPSKAAQGSAAQIERQKWKHHGIMSDKERQLIDIVQQQERTKRKEREQEQERKKRKQEHDTYNNINNSEYDKRKKQKKAKGPNPLSCKKRKV